nr:helix-turn-helix domain-containing protein [Myxococcus fulvus]
MSPLLAEVRQLRAEVDRLRRALPAQLVSAREAARVTGVNEATIRRRVRDGSLPARRVGKRLLVDLASLSHAPTADDVADVVARLRRGSE